MKARSRIHTCALLVRLSALVASLFVLWACVSHPLVQPTPDPGQETHAEITIVPVRHLDLLFMVDNSASMTSKQQKMKKQFPELIEALRDPIDQTLPDMRIAIIDSDLGGCKADGSYGDEGRFQMRSPTDCGVNADARWLEYKSGNPVNFTGDVRTVFGCVAIQVGVAGCGYEHQLAALEWAFFLTDNQSQKNDFIRPEAYLGIVLLTDEDDCSAPLGSRMFEPSIPTESTSLRCATRAHTCANTKLTYPTTAAVSVPYDTCSARSDATCDEGQVDTSNPTDCNPLMNVTEIANAIKQLKGGGADADDKILVAGIYGKPRPSDPTVRPYQIQQIHDTRYPAPNVYDYLPICYDPDHMPSGSGYDQDAAENGAYGGLRIDAFLNEFSEQSRLAYSICESDYGPAMAGIGKALRNKMGSLCVPFKLLDTSDEPGLQADCRVVYRKPVGVKDGQIQWKEDDHPLPRCDSSRKPDCWEVKFGNEHGTDDEKDTAVRCPAKNGQRSQMINVVHEPNSLPEGTKVAMQCLSCVDLPSGMKPSKGCDY